MSDNVPSIRDQGLSVSFLRSPMRGYNSGSHNGVHFLCRCFDERLGTSRLVWHRRSNLDLRPLTELDLNCPWHLEDGRLFRHDGDVYVAYTEGHYETRPFLAVQGLARLNAFFGVDRLLPIAYGGNGRSSEKNWQFFSHDGALHFVYSIEPHVVVRLDWPKIIAEYATSSIGHWPWGVMRGGTPPLRLGDEYISFFHSFRSHRLRQRRYTMSAYKFEAAPPFRITGITEPLLSASENDPTLPHPGHPDWKPLVIFPCAAWPEGKEIVVSAGVNDSFDALIRVDPAKLEWLPGSDFDRPRSFFFYSSNGSLPVRGSSGSWLKWKLLPKLGGPGHGILETADPTALESLQTMRGVSEISSNEYDLHAKKAG